MTVESPLLLTSTVQRHARHAHDHYDTPSGFVKAGLDLVTEYPNRVLDPGAGRGVWGAEVCRRWPDSYLVGVEVQPELGFAPGYTSWVTAPFQEWASGEFPIGFDLICGNPPFKEAEAWIRAGLQLLNPGGTLLFMLRLAFLESNSRSRGLFRDHPPALVSVCSKRPVFYGRWSGGTAIAFFLWRKDWTGATRLHWSLT